ncbi:hypothetical protein M427DRAFT_396252 [Gonapodya prolifera JEL478]|uniref:CID domain-containing protein n=1 Tax=Gonapodya prolifera (strain JEL478) TaxID=1344416 RepID=A0A139A6D2_GONPJ|nr:hypothetical protein M427DRAFT_396252 [Gonapodya prolifera JEL478]|eukprot:KXS12362.1 hypothetical protein M427DRAFT_396252 [Gonapodya prolifera JEL478]
MQGLIEECARYMLEYTKIHQKLYRLLRDRIMNKAHPPSYRVKFFYVLDSLCQTSVLSGFRNYIDLAQADLPEFLNWCFPNKADAQEKLSESRLGTFRRILDAWRKKSIFEEQSIKTLEQKLDDIDAQRVLQSRMDQDRERQKSSRDSAWQLPYLDTTASSEFNHLWTTRTPFDQADVREILEQRELEALDKNGFYDPTKDRFEAVENGGWKGFDNWEGYQKEENGYFMVQPAPPAILVPLVPAAIAYAPGAPPGGMPRPVPQVMPSMAPPNQQPPPGPMNAPPPGPFGTFQPPYKSQPPPRGGRGASGSDARGSSSNYQYGRSGR